VDAGARLREEPRMDENAVATRLDEVWRYHRVAEPRERLAEWRRHEADMEYRFSIPTPAAQLLLVKVCARYGLKLYRPARARQTTLCVEAPSGFVREVLWPVYEQMARIVEDAALEASRRVIEHWAGKPEQTDS
jgi:hypothetical protein